jgi:NAD(P)-dependent dehydrogenase (short-subunit alcohol dehydrogenase family)
LEQAARELQADSSAEVAVVVADLADPAGPERERAPQPWHARLPREQCRPTGLWRLCPRDGSRGRAPDDPAERGLDRAPYQALSARDGRARLRQDFDHLIARGTRAEPKLDVYSATEAFDFAFAEAIANELKDTGVSVTALLPGRDGD